MRLKELEGYLQELADFQSPKVQLEQYSTRPHIAATMLHLVSQNFDDLEGSSVIDLGCGTGMLSAGAALMGSPAVLGIDIDLDALCIARQNVEEADCCQQIDLLQADVSSLMGPSNRQLSGDTVVMNPPFGTRLKGADAAFLQAAWQIATKAAYSLHKSSTRQHIQRLADRQLGAGRGEVLCQVRYNLPATYAFHKAKMKDIEVDLWRFDMRHV